MAVKQGGKVQKPNGPSKGIEKNPKQFGLKAKKVSTKKNFLKSKKPLKKTLTKSSSVVSGEKEIREKEAVNKKELSTSGKRKLLKRLTKIKRNPDYKKKFQLNQLYAKLLGSGKNSDDSERLIRRGIKLLLEEISKKPQELRDDVAVSRFLQAALKRAEVSVRSYLVTKLAPLFPVLCGMKYGSKLASKLFTYAPSCDKYLLIRSLTEISSQVFESKRVLGVFEQVYNSGLIVSKKILLLNSIVFTPQLKLKIPNWQTETLDNIIIQIEDKRLREEVLETVEKLVDRALEKGGADRTPVHDLILFLLNHRFCMDSDKISSFAEKILTSFTALGSSKNGMKAVVKLLGHITAKQRKKVVKESITDFVATATNGLGHLLILRLLTTIDDTKLLGTTIIKELRTHMHTCCFDKNASKIILYLVDPNTRRYLTEQELQLLAEPTPTSLKTAEKRNDELLTILSLHEFLFNAGKRPFTGAPLAGASALAAAGSYEPRLWLTNAQGAAITVTFLSSKMFSELEETARNDLQERFEKTVLAPELQNVATQTDCFLFDKQGHRHLQIIMKTLYQNNSVSLTNIADLFMADAAVLQSLINSSEGCFVLSALLALLKTSSETSFMNYKKSVLKAFANEAQINGENCSSGMKRLRELLLNSS